MKPQWVQALVLVVSVGVGLVACESTDSTGGGSPTVGRPECPADSFVITVVDTVHLLTGIVTGVRRITTMPVAGPISNVPEFHDCQEFIQANGYLTLHAIW